MQLKQAQKTESLFSKCFHVFPDVRALHKALRFAFAKGTTRTTSSDPASSALSNRLWSLWSKHLSCKCAKAIISSLSVLEINLKVIANWSVGFAFSSWRSCWHRQAERACQGLSTRSFLLGYASKQGTLVVNITKKMKRLGWQQSPQKL